MILHYLKIAGRNLCKYKTQTIISIVGLTIGVVFFTYGYHWYSYETTYDSFYPDSKRIYHLYGRLKSSGKQIENGHLPYIAAEKLTQQFPEIASVAVLHPIYGSPFKHNDRDLGYPSFEFVDELFFRMFPPKVVAGVIHENSLKSSHEMIITESYARKYFGTPEDALGETMVSGYDESYVIQAVIADSPVNSIFQKEGYVPDTHARSFLVQVDEATQWRDLHDTRIYLKMKENVDLDHFRNKLSTFAIDNKFNEDLILDLCPLPLVRFNLMNMQESQIRYDVKYIRMFIFVGVLLLFIALFNFLNILHSSTVARFREINLRRVTGASIHHIYQQLFVEISLHVVIVALLSFCCIEVTSGLFERIFGTVVSSSLINTRLFFTMLLTAMIVYCTAFVILFRFVRKSALKKDHSAKSSLTTGRITLLLQLIISSFAIMSAFVTWKQVDFMNHADWGFDTENLLQIQMKVRDREPLMEEIEKLPSVREVIKTGFFTVFQNTDKLGPSGVTGVGWDHKPIDLNPHFQTFDVDADFIEKMKLEIIVGRGIIDGDFTGGNQASKVLINKSAQRVMEMDDPIGQSISVPANWYTKEGRGKDNFEIVGVVEDFHTVGLHSEIPPLIIKVMKETGGGYFNYVRVMPGMEAAAMEAITTLIPKFRPDNENESLVVSMIQLLSDLSKNEQHQLRLFATLASLCILITVFGIYSVSQRETRRRRKEIAIRKTAGAKSKEIMHMFFREYLTLTLIAVMVALPLSGLFMEQWLQNFAYRITISWWMYVVVLLIVASIVILAIVTQVTRAANQNPAEVVKSE
jgi:hypothetical protein